MSVVMSSDFGSCVSRLSKASFKAFTPSVFEMFVYSERTSIVIRSALSGKVSKDCNLLIKSVVSCIYDFTCFANGWIW